jgi:hypothetical protein
LTLAEISQATHQPFSAIIRDLPLSVTGPALQYPEFSQVLGESLQRDPVLKEAIHQILHSGG